MLFEGFLPAHAIYEKWKSINNASYTEEKRQKRRRRKCNSNSASALLTDKDWNRIWDPVREIVEGLSTPSTSITAILKLNWKDLGRQHHDLKQAMKRSASLHNDILREAIKNKEQQQQVEAEKGAEGGGSEFSGGELPTLFRLSAPPPQDSQDDGCGMNDATDHDSNTFFVFCPLADVPNQFQIEIPPGLAEEYPLLPRVQGSSNNNDRPLDFKPSLTKCTVLERGTLERNIDITKVLLHPITGRRHQLRVHMALTGFPILGDSTYGTRRDMDSSKDSGERYSPDRHIIDEDNNNEGEAQLPIDDNKRRNVHACSRMYLHAQSLALPSLLGEKNPGWKVETPDPFTIGEDGRLHLNHHRETKTKVEC